MVQYKRVPVGQAIPAQKELQRSCLQEAGGRFGMEEEMGYQQEYEFWLKDAYFDEKTKEELRSIAGNEKR